MPLILYLFACSRIRIHNFFLSQIFPTQLSYEQKSEKDKIDFVQNRKKCLACLEYRLRPVMEPTYKKAVCLSWLHMLDLRPDSLYKVWNRGRSVNEAQYLELHLEQNWIFVLCTLPMGF